MKKDGHIIILAMAAQMCAACSHDSDESGQGGGVTELGTPIAFAAMQGEEEKVTRGIGLEDKVTSFTVWAYKSLSYENNVFSNNQKVFPGYVVSWENASASRTVTNSDGWEYILTSQPEQTIKYWDWSAKAYRFYAVTGTEDGYTDYAASGTYGESYETVYFTMTADASPIRDGDDTEKEKIAANIADVPYFSKLWFSTGNITDYPGKAFGKPVQLEFMQPFAKVRFMFTYAYEAEGIRLKDKSFKPTDGSKIDRKGTFTVTYPLEGTAIKEWYTVTPNANPEVGERLEAFTENYIPDGGVDREIWYTVLPIDPSVTQGSYTLSVNVNGSTKTCVVPSAYMQWRPGFSYTYIFKITSQGGVEIDCVQSAFTPWDPRESQNYEVYNW